jgi:putative glycosyltransferase
MLKISLVSTLYHSEKYLPEFYARIQSIFQELQLTDYELILVNDGSPDSVLPMALDLLKTDKHLKIVDLSKNFGHHKAIRAGLEQASGDLIFLIDVDLEEDPEILALYLKTWLAEPELDVIYGVQAQRKGKWFERISGSIFYGILHRLIVVDYPADQLTARLMTRRYVNCVLQFTERTTELWSIFAMTGFNNKGLTAEKKSKGSTTYSFYKKLAMAFSIIVSLSNKPLYWVFFSGLGLILFAVLLSIFGIFAGIEIKNISLKTNLIVMIALTAIIVCGVGVVGIYVAQLITEVRKRPHYIIRKIYTSEDFN